MFHRDSKGANLKEEFARMRRFKIIFLVPLLALIGIFFSLDFEGSFGRFDFLEYWAGSQLFLTHQNPYDIDAVKDLQSSLKDHADVILLWNPPLAFPLFFYLALFPYQIAAKIWFLIKLFIFGFTFLGLSKFFKSDYRIEGLRTVLCIGSFYPLYSLLVFEQIGAFLLLGSAMFILNYRLGKNLRAGLWLSLTLIKPHCLFLLYLWIGLEALRSRNVKLILGIALGATGLLLLPLLYEPRVLEWYLEAISTPPIYWKTPTIGSLVQGMTDVHHPIMRMAPALLLGCLLIPSFYAKSLNLERVLFIMPLSFLVSPYGWAFDMVLLLPTALWIMTDRRQWIRVSLVAIGFLALGVGERLPLQFDIIYLIIFAVLSFFRFQETHRAQ